MGVAKQNEPHEILRDLREDDAWAAFDVELRAYSSPWAWAVFEPEFRRAGRLNKGYFIEGRLVGYVLSFTVCQELHILNVAVDPEYQRRGIGEAIVRGALEEAKRRDTTWASLEVRVSNRRAIQLYQRLGFQLTAVRKSYYRDTGEDALILESALSP